MSLELFIMVFILVFLGTLCLTNILCKQLKKYSVLDCPNDRSSHSSPTPKGGGIAILAVFFLSLFTLSIFDFFPIDYFYYLFLICSILGTVSFLDDIYGLHPILRLIIHAVCVYLAISFGLIKGGLFSGLVPPFIEVLIITIVWVWFVNLFNFMDGIDGIIGVQTVAIGIGVLLIASSVTVGLVGLILAAAACGFLVLNWYPAKIFLGDVGSIPVGFLVGWLLLSVAAESNWISTIILSIYFLIDTGFTMLKRLLKGELIWVAHKEHFYQVAAQQRKTHSSVSGSVAIANIFFVILAIFAASGYEKLSILGSLIVLALLIFWMLKKPIRQ